MSEEIIFPILVIDGERWGLAQQGPAALDPGYGGEPDQGYREKVRMGFEETSTSDPNTALWNAVAGSNARWNGRMVVSTRDRSDDHDLYRSQRTTRAYRGTVYTP